MTEEMPIEINVIKRALGIGKLHTLHVTDSRGFGLSDVTTYVRSDTAQNSITDELVFALECALLHLPPGQREDAAALIEKTRGKA
jgi:hypothetical protein